MNKLQAERGISGAGKAYAPVWVALFSTGATLFRAVGERYLLKRQWQITWSDVGMAAGGALLGYVTFRYKHGQRSANPLKS